MTTTRPLSVLLQLPFNTRRCVLAFVIFLLGSWLSGANAQSTITFAAPAVVNVTNVSSTATNANITVPTDTWQVGDIIRFYGTTATTNPFGTTATTYYVKTVSGTTLTVAATPGGTAVAATNTTTVSTVYQAQDWFTTSNWTGGVAPNTNSVIASFAAPAANVPAIVINGAATIYGLNDVKNGVKIIVDGEAIPGVNVGGG